MTKIWGVPTFRGQAEEEPTGKLKKASELGKKLAHAVMRCQGGKLFEEKGMVKLYGMI